MGGPNPSIRLAYTVTFTADEFRTLQWCEDHGYTAGMIAYATEQEDHDDGSVTLKYRESDAWQVHADAHDADTGELDHAFGACATPSVVRKMLAFVDGIV